MVVNCETPQGLEEGHFMPKLNSCWYVGARWNLFSTRIEEPDD